MSGFDVERLRAILDLSTFEFRNGEELEGTPALVEQAKRGAPLTAGGILEVFSMPHVSAAHPGLELVDVEFMTVGVRETEGTRHKAELIKILGSYPAPDRLAAGPSYIEVGAEIGDQGYALRLYALGHVLKMWRLLTPAFLGLSGEQARKAAGRGFIMMTGFKGGRI